MGIRRMSYLDIPKDLRDQKVREVQTGLRNLLSDPTVSKDQRLAARARAASLQRWADGELPVAEPAGVRSVGLPAPVTPSRHHDVEVVEVVKASESPLSEAEPEPESIEVDIEPDSEETEF
jgi:hypothetical protein